MTFPRRERLPGGNDFTLLNRQGRRWANRFLVLRARPNGRSHNRFGFVASRQLGPAVARNRLRRQLREGVKLLSLRPGWDILFIARLPAREAGFEGMKQAAGDLLSLAGLIEEISL